MGALRFRSFAMPIVLSGAEQCGVTRRSCAPSCAQGCIAASWRDSPNGAMMPHWPIGFKMPPNRHPGRRHIDACSKKAGVRGSITRRMPNASSRSVPRTSNQVAGRVNRLLPLSTRARAIKHPIIRACLCSDRRSQRTASKRNARADRNVSGQSQDPFPYFPRDEIRRRGIRLVMAKSEIIRIKDQTTGAKILPVELANHGAPKMGVTYNAPR